MSSEVETSLALSRYSKRFLDFARNDKRGRTQLAFERCFDFAQHDRMKIAPFAVAFLSLATPLFGQQTPQSLAESELPSLLTTYKDLHTNPELSTHEQRTAAIVAKDLKAAGCEVTENFGKYPNPGLKCYGVVGVMKNGAGPTVLVRTDLDALPVEEETGLPYASKVVTKNDEGKEVHVMHACGHDIHMSVFIGIGAGARETERSMARHDSVYRTTGGRNGRRRARDAGGWPLHKISEAGFRARRCTTMLRLRPAKSG